jgi:hypothetical protein
MLYMTLRTRSIAYRHRPAAAAHRPAQPGEVSSGGSGAQHHRPRGTAHDRHGAWTTALPLSTDEGDQSGMRQRTWQRCSPPPPTPPGWATGTASITAPSAASGRARVPRMCHERPFDLHNSSSEACGVLFYDVCSTATANSSSRKPTDATATSHPQRAVAASPRLLRPVREATPPEPAFGTSVGSTQPRLGDSSRCGRSCSAAQLSIALQLHRFTQQMNHHH